MKNTYVAWGTEVITVRGEDIAVEAYYRYDAGTGKKVDDAKLDLLANQIASDVYRDDHEIMLDDFWHDLYLEKSNYYYEGSDKLYPDSFNFVENKTWTKELTVAYYKEKEEKKKREEEAKLAAERRDYEDRLNRSRYDYSGSRKLYPKDANFVKNDTWTEHYYMPI